MDSHLKSLAYRMLGSVADAEDIVQEAQLRLHLCAPQPGNRTAYLYRIVSNLCLDKLRHEQVRRKHYVGPWLPEPLTTDSADITEMAEQLSLGFMLMLDRLSPGQRVVYLLREGFDFSFAEIAEILETSVSSARQQAHRARSRLAGASEPVPVDGASQKAMLEAMLVCVAERDIEGLIGLMSQDVIAYTDGGGVVSAAIAPVHGPARIARITMHLAQKASADGALRFEFKPMNGGWGLLVRAADAIHSCFQIDVAEGKVKNIYVMRNPAKLTHVEK